MADDFTPIKFEKLFADIPAACQVLYDDIEHFTALPVDKMQRLYVQVRKHKPHPEFKDEHKYLLDQMKEEIEYKEDHPEIPETPGLGAIEQFESDARVAEKAAGPKVELVEDEDDASDLVDELIEHPSEAVVIDDVLDGVRYSVDSWPKEIVLPARSKASSEVAEYIAEDSCIFEFYQSEPTLKKKVAVSELVGDGATTGLSVSKALIDAPELRSLFMHRRRFNKALAEYTLPGGPLTLAGGQHLVPLRAIPELKRMVVEYISLREALLEKFGASYSAIVENEKGRLGSMFNAKDYPPFEEYRAACSVHHKFVSNKVPDEIRLIDEGLFEQETARMHNDCAEAAAGIEFELRTRLIDQAELFADRLGNDPVTGRPKQLHSTVVDSVKGFFFSFSTFNLTRHAGLQHLADRGSGLIGRNTAESIRNSEPERIKLKEGFDKIRKDALRLGL